jgi:hypothetical protein
MLTPRLMHQLGLFTLDQEKISMRDITPEKRYAIWNHKGQKFDSDVFSSYTDAKIALNARPAHWKCYIVEWEIKDDSEIV